MSAKAIVTDKSASAFNTAAKAPVLGDPRVIPSLNKAPKAKVEASAEPKAPAVAAPAAPVVPAVDEGSAARAKRKEEWSMAEKARAMEANAIKLQKEAKAYEEALTNFDKDPLALAKVLNIPVDQLLRKLQGAAFNLPTEKVLSAEEEYRLKTMEYEEREKKRDKELADLKDDYIRTNYINKNFLPILAKDPDKYELIHKEGLDESAMFCFGEVINYYREQGKEPNPKDILDDYEAELEKNFNAIIDNFQGVKKFKSKFQQKQEAAAEAAAAADPTILPAVNAKEPKEKPPEEMTEDELLRASGPKKKRKQSVSAGEKQIPYDSINRGPTREERLARLREDAAARGE